MARQRAPPRSTLPAGATAYGPRPDDTASGTGTSFQDALAGLIAKHCTAERTPLPRFPASASNSEPEGSTKSVGGTSLRDGSKPPRGTKRGATGKVRAGQGKAGAPAPLLPASSGMQGTPGAAPMVFFNTR